MRNDISGDASNGPPSIGVVERGPIPSSLFGPASRRTSQLVLSLFPGIGLLDMAFEEAGFCVVRGPDLLWGGDVRRFHPPAGRFDGVIGGPPCQFASEMSRLNLAAGKTLAENLIPEFERIVAEAGPRWFVMENVVQAPAPAIARYAITENVIRDAWCGGETMRRRRMSIGMLSGQLVQVDTLALHRPDPEIAITSCAREDRHGRERHLISGKMRVCSTRGKRLPVDEMARRQGLPAHFFGAASPFTVEAQRKMIGNGVPLAMGRAVAAAVIKATCDLAVIPPDGRLQASPEIAAASLAGRSGGVVDHHQNVLRVPHDPDSGRGTDTCERASVTP